MPIVDVFNSKPFEMLDMVEAVNRLPYKPGQIGALGLFTERGIATTHVAIEDRAGEISLIQTSPRGGPPTQHKSVKRTIYDTRIPHIAIADTINADEVQGVRVFGTEGQLQAIAQIRNDRLQEMADKLDVTLEHLMFGAMKGAVLDADGTTTIVNLFTLTGKSQAAEVDFQFDSTTAGETIKLVSGMRRTMLNRLQADATLVSEIVVLGDATFMDNLQNCKDFLDSYKFDSVSEMLRQARVFGELRWQGVRWIEHRLGSDLSGGSFLGTGKCIMFPAGPSIYRTYYSPGDYLDTVNTLGLPRYASSFVDPKNKYIELELQSNPLPICTRPEALMKGDDGVA